MMYQRTNYFSAVPLCGICGLAFLGIEYNVSDVITLFALCLYTGYIVFSGARRCNGAQVVMIVLE